MSVNYKEILKRWTLPKSYFGPTWDDFYSAGFGQSRDSDPLERSNFAVAWDSISEVATHDETQVVREGHWAVGWVEWIAIHESDLPALEKAASLVCATSDYPILDEMHFSEIESEEANDIWRGCYSEQERIDLIRKYREHFDFHDFKDLMAHVRGDYYSGDTSLILSY